MLSWQQWFDKSTASISAARNSLTAGDFVAVVSRAYFAVFQVVTGSLIKLGQQPNVLCVGLIHEDSETQIISGRVQRTNIMKQREIGDMPAPKIYFLY